MLVELRAEALKQAAEAFKADRAELEQQLEEQMTQLREQANLIARLQARANSQPDIRRTGSARDLRRTGSSRELPRPGSQRELPRPGSQRELMRAGSQRELTKAGSQKALWQANPIGLPISAPLPEPTSSPLGSGWTVAPQGPSEPQQAAAEATAKEATPVLAAVALPASATPAGELAAPAGAVEQLETKLFGGLSALVGVRTEAQLTQAAAELLNEAMADARKQRRETWQRQLPIAAQLAVPEPRLSGGGQSTEEAAKRVAIAAKLRSLCEDRAEDLAKEEKRILERMRLPLVRPESLPGRIHGPLLERPLPTLSCSCRIPPDPLLPRGSVWIPPDPLLPRVGLDWIPPDPLLPRVGLDPTGSPPPKGRFGCTQDAIESVEKARRSHRDPPSEEQIRIDAQRTLDLARGAAQQNNTLLLWAEAHLRKARRTT